MVVDQNSFLLAGHSSRKKITFANLSRTPCLTFAGVYPLEIIVVLHSSLSTSIKHHFGSADEVAAQGRLARTLNHHHWMNQQNWWRMSWKSYQRCCAHVLLGLSLLGLGRGPQNKPSHSPMLSRNFRESFAKKCRIIGGFLGAQRNNEWQQQQQQQ